jgi:4-deoxy-L-threo-5-hexosulose-uronate ketol-isomerase
MKTRYSADRVRYKTMTTSELREAFLIQGLFRTGEIALEYLETERAVVGSAAPGKQPLKLEAGKELASEYFCERRELGVLNIGGAGKVTVDGTGYDMQKLDVLYVGRGSKEVLFSSAVPEAPAKFYLLSYPSHAVHPTRLCRPAEAESSRLGCAAESNVRTIRRYIHADGIKSCQLVMGVTVLEPGSVWNTMPAHTHERRSEVYLYFDLAEKAAVFHLMGPGGETRHLVVHDGEAVISPIWSIHSGVGTSAYTFCWGMGGENQVFGDMDGIGIPDLK